MGWRLQPLSSRDSIGRFLYLSYPFMPFLHFSCGTSLLLICTRRCDLNPISHLCRCLESEKIKQVGEKSRLHSKPPNRIVSDSWSLANPVRKVEFKPSPFITSALCPPSQIPIPVPCENHSQIVERSVCPPPEVAKRSLTFRIPEQSLTNRSGRNGGPTPRNRSKTRKSLFRNTLI